MCLLAVSCMLSAVCTVLQQPGDISRYFTMVGIAASFISTFFAHGFLTLARQAIWQVSLGGGVRGECVFGGGVH